jgi:hypothetical protein
MDTPTQSLRVYKDLAEWYERNGQPPMRDRFLVLAADAALAGGQPEEAEQLRQQLLHANRHHMLRPFASFSEAAEAPDVQAYLHDLRVNYPPEIAAALLDTVRADETAPPHETAPHYEPPAPRPPQPAAPPIPPTAPLMDLFARDPTLSWVNPVVARPLGARAAPAEFNERGEEKPPRPAPAQPPATHRKPTAPRAPEPQAEPPRPRPASAPTAAAPLLGERQPAPALEPPADEPRRWVSWVLAGVALAAGLGWAFLALVRPYW